MGTSNFECFRATYISVHVLEQELESLYNRLFDSIKDLE